MRTNSSETRFCEKEQVVVAAMLAGALPDDLLAHVSVCEVCTEVAQVSQALLHEVAPAADLVRLPDARQVWNRAEILARQRAIAKATRPIRIARLCAGLATLLALPWLAPTLLNSMPDFSHQLLTMDHTFSGALTGTPLIAVGASLILITLSSWYVLRQE
ncbi:MAG TPA: hypothetical protein VJP02_26735 [Candidatus Sulfotelmatobacter sp.]|nr:hypothetical protein [Candidatus Sulfotelmatobacter sp.]